MGNTRLSPLQEKKKRGKTKTLSSTEQAKINVTVPPDDAVFTGQLFESGGSLSREVSGGGSGGVSGLWETSQAFTAGP